ncbi:MAG: 3'-5' exonuclease [Bacteroidetes bacterium]|nr:3'-5' exonuclease [Bacteroidota bacterium]
MRKHNLAFVDIETTGFDKEKHEIIELGLVLVKQLGEEGKNFEIIEEIEYKIKPEHIETADPQALKVNGYDASQWIFASGLAEVMKNFAEKTRDSIFTAHNLTFDYSFVERAFEKTGVENKMFYPKIDTISFAYAKLHKNLKVEKFRLQKLCEYFGIENPKAHTALADARATFEVYKKLVNI